MTASASSCQRALVGLAAVVVAVATGCSEAAWVCPDGVLGTRIAIRDGDVFYSAPGRNGSLGTIDDTPVSQCTHIMGGVYLAGEIDHLRMFDSVVRLSGISGAYGVRVGDGVNDFFPELEVVNGSFYLSRGWDVGMNKLRYVGGDFFLPAVDGGLQSLEEIGGDSRGFSLEEGALPKLRRIGGNYEYSDSGKGLVLEMLPALEEVGGNFTAKSDNGSLTFPSLRHVGGDFTIGGSEGWLGKEVHFPALETVGGYFAVGVVIELDVLDFPQLKQVEGGFGLGASWKLSELDGFPALEAIRGDVSVRRNLSLEWGEVEQLLEQVDVGGEVDHCGNLDDEPCES